MISLPFRARLTVAAMVLLPGLAPAQQTGRVRAEENFRRVPNGEILARVQPGTPLTVVGRGEEWLEVELEGWVWTRSLQATEREGLDLVVSQAGGENLRADPSGTIVGRLQEGALLEELERLPAWIRVRRRGWIWQASVEETATPTPPATVRAQPRTAVSDPAAAGAFLDLQAGAILDGPDGDTLARTAPRAQVEVLGREGSWVRVRLEGWAWLPPAAAAEERPGAGAVAITPADLATDAAGHQGRVVSWDLQYISLERAEKVRTDFFEGEPFLLTRFGDATGPFVYVALPPDRVSELQGLAPLERIRVNGRVRTGASALTGTPIIDMLSWERARDAG